MHHRIDTILERPSARPRPPHSTPKRSAPPAATSGTAGVIASSTPSPSSTGSSSRSSTATPPWSMSPASAGGLFTGAGLLPGARPLAAGVFQVVLHDLVKALVPETHAEGPWRGHRTFLIDGSAFSMPDTPELQEQFGQPGAQAPGCGFPVAKILALFHAGTGVLLKVMAAPLRSHEMASVGGVHPALGPGDVLVGDRGFCSFAHLAMLVQGRRARGLSHAPAADRRLHPEPAACPARREGGRPKACPDRAGCGAWACSIRWSSGSSPRTAPSG